MNRTLISLVVTALFAGAGNAALAQQGTEAPTAASKSAYTAAQDKAQTTYMNAAAKCEAGPGAPTASCLSNAQTARTKALADAKATYEGKSATMTPEPAPQTSARSGDGPTVDSGTQDGLLSAEERKEQPGQATSSADSQVVRSGSDPIVPQQGGTPTGTSPDDTSNAGNRAHESGEASRTTSGTDTPLVTSSNAEGSQGGSEPAMDNPTSPPTTRDKTSARSSSSRADKAAADATAQAQYKQAMAKCDAVSGATKFTCREKAEQERRDALAQAAANGNNEARRSRTGRDDLSANDEPEYRNVSTARGDAK